MMYLRDLKSPFKSNRIIINSIQASENNILIKVKPYSVLIQISNLGPQIHKIDSNLKMIMLLNQFSHSKADEILFQDSQHRMKSKFIF